MSGFGSHVEKMQTVTSKFKKALQRGPCQQQRGGIDQRVALEKLALPQPEWVVDAVKKIV